MTAATGLLLACLALVLAASALAQKQCDLKVLFESHCPDSKDFIHRQLVPVWHTLEPHCTLDLVPFGKAWRNRLFGTLSCQHGPKECRGNMVMSCAYNRLPAGRQQLDFTSCFMAGPDTKGPECAALSGLNWEDIESCTRSEEGKNLQKEAEIKSVDNIKTSQFVPTLVINRQYSQTIQDDAMRSGMFNQVMCHHLDNQFEFCN